MIEVSRDVMNVLAIKGGEIWTVTKGRIRRGTILINRNKIVEFGPEIRVPEGATVIDAEGRIITPGLIDAHTHLGILPLEEGGRTADAVETTDPVTPQLRAIDGVNPLDPGFREAVEGGVTTVLIEPGSEIGFATGEVANVIAGQGFAVKTGGANFEGRILKNPAGIKMALGEHPKRTWAEKKKMPTTRMGIASMLREILYKTKAYIKKKEKACDPDSDLEVDLKLEAMAMVLKREIPARVHANRAEDIMTAIRLAEEFGFDLVLEHAFEGHMIASEMASRGIPAVVGPILFSRRGVELKNLTPKAPALLSEAGVKVCLTTDHPTLPLQRLRVLAGLAMREGMKEEDAIKSITINPAEVIGISDRVGSIEVGKDADLVIFEGDPLEPTTKVKSVLIDGEVLYQGK